MMFIAEETLPCLSRIWPPSLMTAPNGLSLSTSPVSGSFLSGFSASSLFPVFNTNKLNTGNKLDALKPLKKDPETGEVDKDNPFGAVIKEGGQILDKHGKVSSAMNIINEEGDWDTWSRNLSSQ